MSKSRVKKRVNFNESVDVLNFENNSEETRLRMQDPNEVKSARILANMEQKRLMNADPQAKKDYVDRLKRKELPLNKRLTDSILRGLKDDAIIRKAQILSEYQHAYWWTFGGKTRNKRSNRGI
jgi:hypothetical protein